jgi:hypothetical protein
MILVARVVRVLVGVLAVRIRVLLNGLVAIAEVGVGESHKHEDQQDSEHHDPEDPRLGPERSEFLVTAFCLGGNGRGDLLKQHLLP